MQKVLRFGAALWLLTALGSAVMAQDQVQIAQWASSAEASSEYTPTSWNAEKATGAPDVLACEDNANAWASSGTSGEETLTLFYDKAVTPTQINIFQSYYPGAIVAVEVIPADGSDPITIRNSAGPATVCPNVFSLDLPEGLPEVNGVTIYLDQSIVNNWNEIDAVELVGMAVGKPDEATESSLESGDYDVYEVTTNDGSGSSDSSSSTSGTQDFKGEWGLSFTCSDGTTIENGIDLTIIQQRSGSTYSVTVVGINGFDPVLAVRDESGNHICNDDSSDAATYGANLPTTGSISPASTSSQVVFDNNSSNDFENIQLIIGGYGGQGGEFLVIVEGMYASELDGVGDPFSLLVSPALLVSEVDPTAYMISVVGSFDPMILLIDEDYNVLNDTEGNPMICDDSGNLSLCWGNSEYLSDSFVSRSQNRQLGGGTLDSMMLLDLDTDTEWGGYYNFAFAGNNTEGDYVAVFHLGTAQQQ